MPTVQRGGVVKRLQIEMVVLVALGIWCMWLQLASSLQSSFFFLWNRKSIQNICHSAKKIIKKKICHSGNFQSEITERLFACLVSYIFCQTRFQHNFFFKLLVKHITLEHEREKEHKHYF